MTRLNAAESALFLMKLAEQELANQWDLRSQLAEIRLKAAMAAIEGNVDMNEFEKKILGDRPRVT